MKEAELASKYLPIFMMDEKEPFEIKAVGYTLFYTDMQSDSFPKRKVTANWTQIKCVIEYAIWFDYDIQHLYELEHVWVYVNQEGQIWKVEGSFHGKYLNVIDLDTGKVIQNEAGRPIVWLQPGKHAILSDPRMVKLVPDWEESCMEKAGQDGMAVPKAFQCWLPDLTEIQQVVIGNYIKQHYAFVPSCRFHSVDVSSRLLVPWYELKESIPDRLARELDKIGVCVIHG